MRSDPPSIKLKNTFLVEPLALLKRGFGELQGGGERVAAYCMFVGIAVLADGLSTFYFLHLDEAQALSEGNPLAARAMDIIGTRGYVFGASLLSLILLPLILLGRPKTPIQWLLWGGAFVACFGKLLAGSWNLYLLIAY